MAITQRRSLGNQGEELVALELERQGFTIQERNYQWRQGEVDLIARHKQMLVFVEVKTRTNRYSNFDLTSVITLSKQRKIIATAKRYLALHTDEEVGCRFDVALIEPDATGKKILTYIPNAFQDEE